MGNFILRLDKVSMRWIVPVGDTDIDALESGWNG